MKSDKKLIWEKRNQQDELDYEILEIVEKHMEEGEAQWYAVDTFWDCPDSPFGWCAYHNMIDPVHDNCIYCHQPQERK